MTQEPSVVTTYKGTRLWVNKSGNPYTGVYEWEAGKFRAELKDANGNRKCDYLFTSILEAALAYALNRLSVRGEEAPVDLHESTFAHYPLLAIPPGDADATSRLDKLLTRQAANPRSLSLSTFANCREACAAINIFSEFPDEHEVVAKIKELQTLGSAGGRSIGVGMDLWVKSDPDYFFPEQAFVGPEGDAISGGIAQENLDLWPGPVGAKPLELKYSICGAAGFELRNQW